MEVQHQGVNEETFIQTGRRGRDGKPGWREREARWQLEDQAVPHLSADKQQQEKRRQLAIKEFP